MNTMRDFVVLLGLEPCAMTDEVVRRLADSYHIETCTDAIEAYDKIHEFDPLLAILDYSLAKLHPIDLHEGVTFVHQHLHIALCVTEENLQVAQRVWNKRGVDYIIKPYGAERFITDVHRIVRFVIDNQKLVAVRKKIKALDAERKRLRAALGEE